MSREEPTSRSDPREPELHPTLTMRGGGWAIVASIGVSLLLITWALSGVIVGKRPVGDGTNLESYGFDLSNLVVPEASMAASGNARDFLQVYENPETILGKDLVVYNEQNRRPWIVTRDRVVGVEINGESRAYPTRCLNAHEVILDTLGGVEIAVTYSPFADAAVVLESGAGEGSVVHGVSGLLCNSALVTYDRGADEPTLFSPVLGRAISGPGAGTPLQRIGNVNLCSWRDWLEQHPETTLILPEPTSNKRYKAFSYLRYYNDFADSLKYPVVPLPEKGTRDGTLPRLKARVVAVTAGGERRVWPVTLLVKALEARGAEEGTIRVAQGDAELEFVVRKLPQSAYVRTVDGSEAVIEPRLFFSWWSSHPETTNDELVRALPEDAVVTPRAAGSG